MLSILKSLDIIRPFPPLENVLSLSSGYIYTYLRHSEREEFIFRFLYAAGERREAVGEELFLFGYIYIYKMLVVRDWPLVVC